MPYQVTTRPTTLNYSNVISMPAGAQTIGVDGFAWAYGTSRPPRSFVSIDNPQLTVIALPPLR
jgi:hypothetical protein